MTPTISVSSDSTALMHDAAEHCLKLYRTAIEARGIYHIALSGGSTPQALFQLFASPEYINSFDWQLVHLWWSDERYVPLDHPDSNYRMANEALISKVPIPARNVHPTPTELAPADAAQRYESDIIVSLGAGASFDVILLGMGNDGHTASLFPGTIADFPPERLVASHFVPQAGMQRITFTPKLINAAHHVVFLVSGKAKTAVLDRVLHGPYQPEVLPSQLIAPSPGEVTWLIDRDAAGDNF
ncbi:MAG TPA: 6-phosphogluconolactonase [Anaerolineae bacterium]|jgi:6-phosphogluconolactonase